MKHTTDEIFECCSFDTEALLDYGFLQTNDQYHFSTLIMDEQFKVDITISQDSSLSTKVYDMAYGDEYEAYLVKNSSGTFASQIRAELDTLYEDIKVRCTKKEYFTSAQANRIAKMIEEIFGDEPWFAWEKSPTDAVYKNPKNGKWYGLIMHINYGLLGGPDTMIDALNVKLNEKKISNLICQKGYFPAYHMNKRTWLTVALDDTHSDEEIFALIEESHKFTENLNTWIIPVNSRSYDCLNCFNETDEILWKQSKSMLQGDNVYIYVTEPHSCILYECQILESDIPHNYQDESISTHKAMKLKLERRLQEGEYNYQKLKSLGIKAIRGPRRATKEFVAFLNEDR